MPIQIDVDRAIFAWQVRHNKKMTYSELARRAGISIHALNRLRSGDTIAPDLRKVNAICKVLECEPGDLFYRKETDNFDSTALVEAEFEEKRRLIIQNLNSVTSE